MHDLSLVKDLSRKVAILPTKKRYQSKAICETLLRLAKNGSDGALEALIDLLQEHNDDVEKRTANTISMEEIESLFGLTYDAVGELWNLNKDQLIDRNHLYSYLVASSAHWSHCIHCTADENLNTLFEADCDKNSEAACRIAADLVMVPAVAYTRRALGLIDTSKRPRYGPHKAGSSSSSTSPASSLPVSSSSSDLARGSSLARLPVREAAMPSTPVALAVSREEQKTPPKQMEKLELQIFPEFELEVELVHKDGKKYIISGKADWAASHGKRNQVIYGSAMLAVEAKQLSTFSAATKQLLCYLAMCRYLRQQNSKQSVTVQGYQTDGYRYQFFCVKNNGHVMSSKIYETRVAGDLQYIFSWIVAMLQTTAYASPSTTPVKKETEKVKVAKDFEKTVLPYVYRGGVEMFDADSDDDLYLVEI